jgi:hypothetical protein
MKNVFSLLRRSQAANSQPHSRTRPESGRRSVAVTQRVVTGPRSEARECGEPTTLRENQRGPSATLPPPRGAVLGAAWTVWALGCGTVVQATPINPAPRPLVPRAAHSVQIFLNSPPPEPHVDIALLEVRQDEGFNRMGTDYMIQRLREKAGELGCDAVLIKTRGERAGVEIDSPFDLADPDPQSLLASCIVYAAPGTLESPAVAAGKR